GDLLHTLPNPTPAALDHFGQSVAVSGNLVVVGAPFDNTGAPGTGAVYLFDAASGSLLDTFTNPTPEAFDEFGRSVAVSGNLVVVGAPFDNTGAQGAGAVYLFDANSRTLLHTFANPTPEAFDEFGLSVAVSGNLVVVGAPFDNTGAQDAGAV